MSQDASAADKDEIVILRVYLGESEIEQEAFTKCQVVIGRDPYADVCLEDPTVSRIHATIEKHDRTVAVMNHSPNGTLVNGRAIQEAVLRHGDTLTIGRFRVELGIHSDDRLLTDQLMRSKGPFREEDQTIRKPQGIDPTL